MLNAFASVEANAFSIGAQDRQIGICARQPGITPSFS
jgi:hypothetical protein